MSITTALETLLFVAGKPVSLKTITKVLGCSSDELDPVLQTLKIKYSANTSGLWLLENNNEWQLVASPKERAVAEQFVKSEVAGDLTRPQLETLTVISYCGPITKPELDQIRGVNCSLILRNLLVRGLVAEEDLPGGLLSAYSVTMDYLRFLGITSVAELPDYAALHNHEFVRSTLGSEVVLG